MRAEGLLPAETPYTRKMNPCGLATSLSPRTLRGKLHTSCGCSTTFRFRSFPHLGGRFEPARAVPRHHAGNDSSWYQVLRINDAPDIEVHIVPSAADPTGMGESAVPPLAPAVADAVFAAAGKRVRRLPIGLRNSLPFRNFDVPINCHVRESVNSRRWRGPTNFEPVHFGGLPQA